MVKQNEKKFWQKEDKIEKGLNKKFAKSLILFDGPHRNRTYNLLIKSQVLCLVELVARDSCFLTSGNSTNKFASECQIIVIS